MIGVLEGFGVIAIVILVGYIAGRTGVLGTHADFVLARIAFYVLSPPLLFTVLARADVHALFSTQLPVAALSAIAMFAIYLTIALLVWKRAIPEAIVGTLGAGYQNANNIGLPLGLYILGDAAASAPIVMLQLIVFAPVALTILDATTGAKQSIARTLTQPLRNPLIIGSVLGVVCAVFDWLPPDIVMAPFDLIAAAAVPILLLNFGLSLAGDRVLAAGPHRKDVILASALKLVAMPVAAWAIARFGFGLEGHALFAAVILAGLPSAQNVFNWSQRYGRGIVIGRDTVFVTTLGSIGGLLLIAWLLTA